jgi:hypothetical protein
MAEIRVAPIQASSDANFENWVAPIADLMVSVISKNFWNVSNVIAMSP